MAVLNMIGLNYNLEIMSILYTLCGIPGSGKSTTAIRISEEKSALLYSYDVFKKTNPKGEKTHELLYTKIKQELLQGYDVVLDDLHTRIEWRQDLLSAIQDILCKKILIVTTTPLEECIQRNAQREGNARLPDSIIYHLNSKYQPPSLKEGWDEIIYI